ncbi:MAG: helix-turn-helix domain-containing protein [Planctomycetes bacterium]|nr:helix-turn-helix domain-containing protein [Planctomycetota bacterium]
MRKLDRVLLTFEEVAEICSISRRSVSRAVQNGELLVVQAPGTIGNKGKRIPLQEVQSWLLRQIASGR